MRRLLAFPFTVAGEVFYELALFSDMVQMAVSGEPWEA